MSLFLGLSSREDALEGFETLRHETQLGTGYSANNRGCVTVSIPYRMGVLTPFPIVVPRTLVAGLTVSKTRGWRFLFCRN